MSHPGARWYTFVMPTSRPRHQVTETPDIARALDVAARRWPHEPRSKLLLRLVRTGSAALEQEQATASESRAAIIEATSGKYRGVFGPHHLADLRREWPE